MPTSSTVVSLAEFARQKKASHGRKPFPLLPEHVCVDRAVADLPETIRILTAVKGATVDVIDDVRLVRPPRDPAIARRMLLLTAHRGAALAGCQGGREGRRCCGLLVLDPVVGCPLECSSCPMPGRAGHGIPTAFVNIDAILTEVSEFLARHPQRSFRIAVGGRADALALDPILDHARVLIPFFARRQNAILEFATKTGSVDHLLELPHGGRTVIAWSAGPPEVLASEERGTAPLAERLAAAAKAAAAGFGVAFRLDPIVMGRTVAETVDAHVSVIDRILEAIPCDAIAWVSLGLAGVLVKDAETVRRRFPESRLFAGELVPIGGVLRYPRFLRQQVYAPLWERLAQKLPLQKLFLCNETPEVWRRIDPSVTSSSQIERRLVRTEPICAS